MSRRADLAADAVAVETTTAVFPFGSPLAVFETERAVVHVARGRTLPHQGKATRDFMAPFHDVLLRHKAGDTVRGDDALRAFAEAHALPIDWT